jgi:thiamine pyrophosphokinase
VEQGAGGIAFSGGKMYTYPAEKDFSDSEAALNVAMNLMKEHGEPGRLDFLCATGGRLDHFLANIGLLNIALRAGIDARILDAKNEIRLIDRSIALQKEDVAGRYVSLIPYTDRVENVTLKGFHYPLDRAEIRWEGTLTISNLCEAETAEILFEKGILILILSGD